MLWRCEHAPAAWGLAARSRAGTAGRRPRAQAYPTGRTRSPNVLLQVEGESGAVALIPRALRPVIVLDLAPLLVFDLFRASRPSCRTSHPCFRIRRRADRIIAEELVDCGPMDGPTLSQFEPTPDDVLGRVIGVLPGLDELLNAGVSKPPAPSASAFLGPCDVR